MGKQSKRPRVIHPWDIDQIIALIRLVASSSSYPRVSWDDIAERHNQICCFKNAEGRTPKAVEGMFGRIRDGFMYLQNEQVMSLMVEHKALWRRIGRHSKKDQEVDALKARVEEQSKQINQLLDALARHAPGASDNDAKISAAHKPQNHYHSSSKV